MSSDTAHPLVGTVLSASYRIDGVLGQGGMGAVYTATHLRLEKRVAVKVMARELADNPEALARFSREALVTGGLGHPHIVQVFDFSTAPTGEPFLVMEFLDGEDLEHRLRRVGPLPAADVIRIVKQVASALMTTHGKGIVHRDLKPANIYLVEVAGETDFVKVLDFGISKVRSAGTKLTRTSSVMGTPNYMSPEQAKGMADDIDERTDQWALACIAWECLSGEATFRGENVPSILFQIVHEAPPSLLPKVGGLHPQVEDVLLRALAKNKNDRFAKVEEFAAALEAALAGTSGLAMPSVARTMHLSKTVLDNNPVGTAAPASTFSQAAREIDGHPEAASVRSKTLIWVSAVAAAAILLVGAFWFFRFGFSTKPIAANPPAATVAKPMPIPVAPPPVAPALPPEPAEIKPELAIPSPTPPPETKPEKSLPAVAPAVKDDPIDGTGGPTQPRKARRPKKGLHQDEWRLD